MNTRVLLAGPAPLLEAATSRLGHLDLTCAADGAALFETFVTEARAARSPALVVIDLHLERISGPGVIQAIRAVERAWSRRPTPILIYAAQPADAELKAFIASVGQTVHLERPGQAPVVDQAARLQVAVDRLLTQLRGA